MRIRKKIDFIEFWDSLFKSFIISDLSSMKDTKEAEESITKVVDRLDVLINNAGAYFPKYRETSLR